MNDKKIIYEFNPVIYPYKIWIVVDKKPDIISDMFNDYNGNPIENINKDTENLEGFAMMVSKKDIPYYGDVIYFRSKKSINFELVAHESSHAAKHLFEHIGADVSAHEPFEFLIGWIAHCCEEVKKNKV